MKLYKIPVHKNDKNGYITIKADSEGQITQALCSMSTEEYESYIHWDNHFHPENDEWQVITGENNVIKCDLDARKLILFNIARENIDIEWSNFQYNYISPMRKMTDSQKRNLLILLFKREIRTLMDDTEKYQEPKISEMINSCKYYSQRQDIKPIPRKEFITGTLSNLKKYAFQMGLSIGILTTDMQMLLSFPAPHASLGTLITLAGYNLHERTESEILPKERPIYEKLTFGDRIDFRLGKIDLRDAENRIKEYSKSEHQNAAYIVPNYTGDNNNNMIKIGQIGIGGRGCGQLFLQETESEIQICEQWWGGGGIVATIDKKIVTQEAIDRIVKNWYEKNDSL